MRAYDLDLGELEERIKAVREQLDTSKRKLDELHVRIDADANSIKNQVALDLELPQVAEQRAGLCRELFRFPLQGLNPGVDPFRFRAALGTERLGPVWQMRQDGQKDRGDNDRSQRGARLGIPEQSSHALSIRVCGSWGSTSGNGGWA